MKKMMLLLLCLNAFSTQAQKQVRIAYGTVFYGSGDLVGSGISNAFRYRVSRFWLTEAELTFSQANREPYNTGDLRIVNAATTLDLNLFFTPLKSQKIYVACGVGVSGRRFVDASPNVSAIYYNWNNQPNFPPLLTVDYHSPMKIYQLGYGFGLDSDFRLNKSLYVGLKSMFHYYTGQAEDTVLMNTVHLGYSF